MKRFIFGFQRRVWWPKWTPASRSSRMLTTDTFDPFSWLTGAAAGGAWVEPAFRLAGTATRPFRRVGYENRKSSAPSSDTATHALLDGAPAAQARGRGTRFIGQLWSRASLHPR